MDTAQILFYLVALLLLARPLGGYMARIYEGDVPRFARWLSGLDRALHRLAGVQASDEQDWREYARSLLAFNLLGLLAVYALQRLQGVLPLDPAAHAAVGPASALDTAVSFATNTNWQAYSGERTLSQLTQMLGLTVQNFASAASGMAVLVALVRGFTRGSCRSLGSFWTDMLRTIVYVLLPLSLVLALLLVAQGVVQNLSAPVVAHTLQGGQQTIAMGPAASQVAIKQLGTNGGGFFNANSAHPLENPTPVSNLFEMLAILLVPAASCFTFGKLVRDERQGRALLATMLLALVPCIALVLQAERAGTRAEQEAGLAGGNMEGKEQRLGIANSAIWAAATTAASNGSVNSMHDSFTPLGGLWPMWLIQLGEVVFGGVGSGLYGMILFAIVAVFVAGLMVGRTPEYLGKKIGAFEMQCASIAILAPCMAVLLGTALAVLLDAGRAGVANPGPHGFSEILYAFSSAGNNNGSAFAGLAADTPFYELALAAAMLVGRYAVALPVLAIAGSLAAKQRVPAGAGTLPTHGALFVGLLLATVMLVGALSFLPALALGPVVEQLQMHG